MPVHVSSYEGGIDRDSSKNKYPKGSYYKMKNFRVISFNELSNGAVNSVKGNLPITITGGSGYDDHFVIGYLVVRNYLVAWSTSCIDNTGGIGTIWRTDLSVSSPSWTKIYENAGMLLTTQHPILEESIGYYESNTIINVYWTDNFNMYRHINIASVYTGSLDQLDILSKVTLEQPVIKNISDGNIYVGKIQYAYQYYNLYGSETVFSPCTPLIHLTKSSERLTGANMRLYEGSDALDDSGNPNNSGKSVKIEIVNADTNYDMVRVVAILYRNLNQMPEIHIVGEYETSNNLVITDYGSYTKGILTLNAFRTLGNGQVYCKTISQKGNKAVIGNITEKFFDIDFDARAYRFSPMAGAHESYRSISPDLTNLINGSTTNTNLYFTFPTPGDIAALTNDAMGTLSSMVSMTLHYTESGPYSEDAPVIDSIYTDGNGSNNVTCDMIDNNHIRVTITNFPTVMGISGLKTITGITSISSDYNSGNIIVGTWHNISHAPTGFNSTKAQSTISVVSYIGTTLIFTIGTSGTPYFNIAFNHFHSGSTYVTLNQFRFTYTYTETLSYTQTYALSDVTFHKDTASLNPANWLWHLTKVSGDFIPCIGTFDPDNFTSITLNMTMHYTWTGIYGVIHIIDTKIGAYQSIITSDDAWPNKSFLLSGSEVPYDHDCICPYNIDILAVGGPKIDEPASYAGVSDFANNLNSSKYQDEGLTILGGAGPNVMYQFISHKIDIENIIPSPWYYDQSETVVIEDLTSFDSYKNPMVEALFMNYKHDEVYRHGIVATNSKGQDSFVHWIGDIKTPTVSEVPLGVQNVDTSVSAYSLGIKFIINTASLVAQDVVSIRIVRVERTKDDRTIYGQGIISHMYLDNGVDAGDPYKGLTVGYPYAILKTPSVIWDGAICVKQSNTAQFICPEINYFKDLSPASSHYIKTVSKFKRIGGATLYSGTDTSGIDVYGATPALTDQLIYHIVEGTLAGIVEYGAKDANKILFAAASNAFLNRSMSYTVFSHPRNEGPSGTCAVLLLDDVVDISELVSADEKELFLVDYKIPGIAESQYGGITYQARQGNTYIECGKPIPITGGQDQLNIYGGDTYVTFHEHLRSMWEVDDNNGDTTVDITYNKRTFNITTFLCESIINCGLSNGFKYSKYYTNEFAVAMREDAGIWNADLADHTMPNHDYDLIQDKNMYLYNSVYSQANTTKVYFCKPIEWLSTVVDDTTVKISLEKSPRELVDSYLKFLTDNKKTLPTQFGPVNDLFLFKNYMMVFFDHAFGSLSIDERAVLPIQNNSILELGTANNLQFFDFISDVSGSIHPSSINKVGNGFAWYDAYNGSFGFYNGETQDLGFVKGLSSYIQTYSNNLKITDGSYFNNQLAGGNFMVFENRRYKESFCAMVISDIVSYVTQDSTSVLFSSTHLPACILNGTYLQNTKIVINGKEFYADIYNNAGIGTVRINNHDNPSLNLGDYSAGNYFLYYKDLSTVFAFSSVTGNFQHELDIFPQHLIQYNEDLFDIFYNKVIYKENAGDYGYFYGIYRNGELELLINPRESIVCIFNNFDYTMEAFDSNDLNLLSETWDSLQEFNDYQYSVDKGTDCTCQDAGDTITKASHGLSLNDRLMFSGEGLPAEIDPTILYWLVNPLTDTFQIALTKGGTPVVFNSDGIPVARIDDIILSGSDGTAMISINGLDKTITWNVAGLNQTAIDFVTAYAADYAASPYSVTLSNPGGGVIRETSLIYGQDFYYDTKIINTLLTLDGVVTNNTPNKTSPQYHILDVPLTLSTLATEGTIRRRMRVWHIKDLRDWRTDKPRMRDTYIRLLFKYQHADGKHIIMHDLYTYYSVTRESLVNH
jgi:hypothetical protein